MQTETFEKLALIVVTSWLVSACAHDTSAQFGNSVRHMTGQQILDLEAAYNPDPAAVVGGDAYTLDDILEAHRNTAEDPSEDRGATVMAPIVR
jgi:hypothetical protein